MNAHIATAFTPNEVAVLDSLERQQQITGLPGDAACREVTQQYTNAIEDTAHYLRTIGYLGGQLKTLWLGESLTEEEVPVWHLPMPDCPGHNLFFFVPSHMAVFTLHLNGGESILRHAHGDATRRTNPLYRLEHEHMLVGLIAPSQELMMKLTECLRQLH